MNLTKSVRCHIRMDSRWAKASAVYMGISIFMRTVYYFGLINLQDLNGFDLAMQVIMPMIIAAGYLLMIKGLRINSPILVGGLVALYAVNYLMIMDGSASAIAGAVLLIATAVLFVVTGLGYLPYRTPLIAVGTLMLAFRFAVVDLMGYILPLSEFHPIEYLPEASNLFGLAAIAAMCPAFQLSPLRRTIELSSQEPTEQPAPVEEAEPAAQQEAFGTSEAVEELELPEEAEFAAAESEVEASEEAEIPAE